MIGLLDLRRRIDAGDLRPRDALAAARERIAGGDADLASFVAVADLPDGPVDPSRPLAGIAVGVKDIVDTADLPTEMGLPAVWGGWRPRADAAIVSQVRAAGGWIAGKTASTALAYLDPTPTRNPHDPARTPGGSSSGSAAAVAAGLVPLAIGTQTGGSVIRPAAFCGVAAIKPSFRLLPTVGVKVQAWTLDTLGLFGAGVDDVAHALEAICGRDMRVGEVPGTVRFGVVVPELGGPPEPEMAAAVDRAARALERHGMAVSAVSLPDDVLGGWHASPIVQGYEARVSLAWELEHHRDRLPPGIGGALDAAASITAADYDAARGRARRARGALRAVFADNGVDVLLSPAAPGPAPARDTTGDPRFNRLWTLLGVPSVNVPGLATPSGLPLGLQVIAPFARDAAALAAAGVLERVLRGLD
jgi:Asp-tRNA(Asn)/Glu-tRNA(Gln) amidotransferase A subunit family amidase